MCILYTFNVILYGVMEFEKVEYFLVFLPPSSDCFRSTFLLFLFKKEPLPLYASSSHLYTVKK